MGQSLRRPVSLHLELLEDRRLPAGNVISGFVYNDLNGNGLRDANEPALVNNPIELRNTSGGVVGTTTTDSNGYYSFDTDSSINTGIQSQVQTINFADATANTIRNQALNQFNPALGSLQSVEIRVDGRIISNIKMENLDDEAASVNGSVSGVVLVNGPGFNLNVNIAGNAAITQMLAAYDGASDYQGASGVTLGNRTATGSKGQTLTGSDMSPYIGSGTLNLSFLAQATTQASGGGNLLANISNQGGGQVTITYRYLNNTGLKAGNYVIVQKAQPAGLLDGRDSQNGVILANSFNTDQMNVTLGDSDSVNNNFGEYRPAALSGFVYQDSNDNGIREATEKLFANSQIKLTGTDDRGTAISLTGQTDAGGAYQFNNLRPGTYSITQNTQPAGYTAGKLTLGGLGGVKGTGRVFSALAVNVGDAGTDYNFAQLAAIIPPAGGGSTSKANLLGTVTKPGTPTPVPPSAVTPTPPASTSKANLLGTVTKPGTTTPVPPSAVTPTPPASTSKANLLGTVTKPGTTTPQVPSAVTPTPPASTSKANLLGTVTKPGTTTPQVPSAVTPTVPASTSKANLLGTVTKTTPQAPSAITPTPPVSTSKANLLGTVTR